MQAPQPSWQSAVLVIMRILLGMWFLLLAYFSAFLNLMSDGCGEPCAMFERQILVGWGIVVAVLVALYILSFLIPRRFTNFGGKVALLVLFGIAGPVVLFVVAAVLSSLAPL